MGATIINLQMTASYTTDATVATGGTIILLFANDCIILPTQQIQQLQRVQRVQQ